VAGELVALLYGPLSWCGAHGLLLKLKGDREVYYGHV